MKRKDFLKNTCKASLCCGAVLAADGNTQLRADDAEAQSSIYSWISDLIASIDTNLDDESKETLLESCGRECARRGFKKVALKYKGNLEGLLSEFKTQLADKVEYSDEDGVARITGKKQSSCECPIAKNSASLSGSICICSQGWYKEIFETVTGRPVWIEPEKTVMRGNERCVHAVYFS